jgi:AcrR family transcriptional regulator
MSTRRLADALNVTPMAIYRHFRNKDALLAALLDEFIREADLFPKENLNWDEWIMYVGPRMSQILSDEPDWITLLGHIEMNPDSQALMLKGLQVLIKAGLPAPEAMRAFFAMAHICVGAALVYQGVRQVAAGTRKGRHDKEYLAGLQSRFGELQVLIDAQHVRHSLQLLIESLRLRIAREA